MSSEQGVDSQAQDVRSLHQRPSLHHHEALLCPRAQVLCPWALSPVLQAAGDKELWAQDLRKEKAMEVLVLLQNINI